MDIGKSTLMLLMNIFKECEPTILYQGDSYKSNKQVDGFLQTALRRGEVNEIDLIQLREYHEILLDKSFVLENCKHASSTSWRPFQGIISKGGPHYSTYLIANANSRVLFFCKITHRNTPEILKQLAYPWTLPMLIDASDDR